MIWWKCNIKSVISMLCASFDEWVGVMSATSNNGQLDDRYRQASWRYVW